MLRGFFVARKRGGAWLPVRAGGSPCAASLPMESPNEASAGRGAGTAETRIPGASPLKPGEARSGDYTPRVDAMANDRDLQFEALQAAISVDRLGAYLGEANDDRALARELYVWDRVLDRGEGLGRCGMIVRRKRLPPTGPLVPVTPGASRRRTSRR